MLQKPAAQALGLIFLTGSEGGIGSQYQEAITHLRLALTPIILGQLAIRPYRLISGWHNWFLQGDPSRVQHRSGAGLPALGHEFS
jgi:hypothetical protein